MMKALRIGLVDIDTSHPNAWVPILREFGHEIAGVYDSGEVRPAGYAAEFTAERGIPKVYESLEAMVDDVDLAIVHSCNWDVHIDRARPFVDAGKSVLIDKPMAGNLKDINTLLEWEIKGARVTGGSSLRYCYEVTEFLAGMAEDEEVLYVYSGAGTDEFNYGIHAYSLVQGILGAGIYSVRHLCDKPRRQIEMTWRNGGRAILTLRTDGVYSPFFATIVTNKRVEHLSINTRNLYRAMLEKILPYLAGDTDEHVPLQEILEGEQAAIAARMSWQQDNRTIYLTDLRMDDAGYDGKAFAAGYRLNQMKRK
ncbi:MAG TPA: Gfo/Idh/MocA family oxidoreductase [Firmicutes bacterium]|nr:Gfo/Idh/MocA family oxidoreductase [Bacillota bacterium]